MRSTGQAMTVRNTPPSALLAPYVRAFSRRDAHLGSAVVYTALPARSHSFLEFYLGDRYRVVDVASGAVHRAPRHVLVGPHALRREDILLSGRIEVFTIRFTAIGFRSLFGIPASALRNRAESAELVLGGPITELEQKLAAAADEQRCAIAERFLLERLLISPLRPEAAVAAAVAHAIERRNGTASLARLAIRNQRSLRQVERLFEEHVGLSPKVFARVQRLEAALRMTRNPRTSGDTSQSAEPDWSAIALAAGYFDQSHLIREFRALTGETPPNFLSLQRRTAPPPRVGNADVAFVQSPAGHRSLE